MTANRPAKHVQTFTQHNATTNVHVTEADGTFKPFSVLNNIAVLSRYQRIIVEGFGLLQLATETTQRKHSLSTNPTHNTLLGTGKWRHLVSTQQKQHVHTAAHCRVLVQHRIYLSIFCAISQQICH